MIKRTILLVLLILNFVLSMNASVAESDMLRRVNNLWIRGYQYYTQGNILKAYEYFKKSHDLYDGKVWSSDYPPVEAINHCLYLLGREDEIDKSQPWNLRKYYLELDTLRYDTDTFKDIWHALDCKNSESLSSSFNRLLHNDTVKGVQDRYIHAKKLEYVGEQCHYQGMYKDAARYLHTGLKIERRLTPYRFRHNLREISEKLVDSYLNIDMGDSAMSVAIQHLEECQNNPSDTILNKGYSGAENLIIRVLMGLQLYEEAWGEIELADSVINARFPNNHHLFGTGWKIEYYKATDRIDKALMMSRKLIDIENELKEPLPFITMGDRQRLIRSLTEISDYESAIPVQQAIVSYCDTAQMKSYYNLFGEQYQQMGLLYMGNQEFAKAEYWLGKADSILIQFMNYQDIPQYIDNKYLQTALAVATKDTVLYNTCIQEMERIAGADHPNGITYEPAICMIKGVYEANNKRADSALKNFFRYLSLTDKDRNIVLENIAGCYLMMNMADSAYVYANMLVEESRDYIARNFENLNTREREIFWNRMSVPFKYLCRAIVENGMNELTGQLYNDVALYYKGLLLTAASSDDYLRLLAISWNDVQRKLLKNEAAVEFIAVPNANADSVLYIALVLRSDSERPHLVKIGYESQVKEAIAQGLSNTSMSELVWYPLREELKHTKTVWFSVDGMLHKLPIEHLPYRKNKLVDEIYQLNRLTSTRELVIHRSGEKANNAILYGNLTYVEPHDSSTLYKEAELVRSAATNPLRFTKDEVAVISSSLGSRGIQCKLLEGMTGTKSSLLSLNNQSVSLLHMATHGYYYDADSAITIQPDISIAGGLSIPMMSQTERAMLRSGLVMSDSILSAYDVSHLKFKALQLVTLSACGSGLGDIGTGEGVFGLQRAFKQAGAQSILMTLWDVDDYMTYRFMEHFYGKLASGYSKNKALASAQKMIRKTKINGVHDYLNPHFWAGYILLDAFD